MQSYSKGYCVKPLIEMISRVNLTIKSNESLVDRKHQKCNIIFCIGTYSLIMSIIKSFPFWHTIQFTFSWGLQIGDPFIQLALKRYSVEFRTLHTSKIFRTSWTFLSIATGISFDWARTSISRAFPCF